VPRGYPRQEVPTGSGDVSGMCLTTDIRTRAYQPRMDRSVQECSPFERQLDRVRNRLAFQNQNILSRARPMSKRRKRVRVESAHKRSYNNLNAADSIVCAVFDVARCERQGAKKDHRGHCVVRQRTAQEPLSELRVVLYESD
jgi:hypothetical protein